MNVKSIIYLLIFLYFSFSIYSEDLNLDELNRLKSMNMITSEEYRILLGELNNVKERENFYNLKVNGRKINDLYPVIIQNDKTYLPVINLFNSIGVQTYSIDGEVLKLILGTDARNISLKTSDPDIIAEKGDFFVESEKFKKLFCKEMFLSYEDTRVSMRLNFETSADIEIHIQKASEKIENRKNMKELLFTSQRKIFDVGYMRFDFQSVLSRDGDSSSKKYERSWSGNSEYQGPLFYGEFTTSYDVRNNQLGNSSLYYPDIYKNHSLKFEDRTAGIAREWGVSFRKETGYYVQGKSFIIKENVPIGSKVELLYLGFVIDIKDSEDGIVEFDNSEIQENRRYTLRVFEANGAVSNIEIDTATNYFQQNRGETEYNISLYESHRYKKTNIEANLYHGITENLTFGAGFAQNPEEFDDNRVEYLHQLRTEVVYGNYIKRYPYTLVVGTEKALNTAIKNYSYDGTFQIDIKDFRVVFDRAEYGKYFKEKSEEKYKVTYNPKGYLQLNYGWEKTKYHLGNDGYKNDETLGINLSKSFKELLLTFDYEKSLKDKDSYEVNMYYNGLKRYNVQLSNSWIEDGKDLEAVLKISNKNVFSIFDYSFEISYSEQHKEKFSLLFNSDYNNWLTGEIKFDETGSERYSTGINRVVDLKNITKPIESIDSTRVKVITFLDENDDGVMDEQEERVEYVSVKIGDQETDTDENGEAMFYGVPNKIMYDIIPTIRKPSYTLGNVKTKLLGQQVGTVVAHIPVKPMLDIFGEVILDDNLKLSDKQKEILLENTLIKVLDENGKQLEYLNPSVDGTFEIGGLHSRNYKIQVETTHENGDTKNIIREVILKYDLNNENRFIIYLDKDSLILKQKSFSEGGEYEEVNDSVSNNS
ncbi:MAG: hypothetical protein ACRC0G_01845 [Fusobacteriaceae bacterium]